MHMLLCYDISSNRKRARFHRFLKEFGLNTQKSVFECELDENGLVQIRREALRCLDPQIDFLRVYRFCRRCQDRVAVSGLGIKLTPKRFQIL
jgi:CRISPR-associated protein Cas2